MKILTILVIIAFVGLGFGLGLVVNAASTIEEQCYAAVVGETTEIHAEILADSNGKRDISPPPGWATSVYKFCLDLLIHENQEPPFEKGTEIVTAELDAYLALQADTTTTTTQPPAGGPPPKSK